VKLVRRKTTRTKQSAKSGIRISPHTFFFYEKRTGAAHFRVEADAEGRLPADQAAGLLAMHCLVRGHTPSDYTIMVEAGENVLSGITEKAEKLLAAGRSVPAAVELSRREEEVLSGIIAAALHLSERTVKFHVSSLLAKFRVRGRMELVREASRVYLPARNATVPDLTPFPIVNRELRPHTPQLNSLQRSSGAGEVLPLPKRHFIASA